MSKSNLSPEARGYIAELQEQCSIMSSRAVQLSGELAAARQKIELQGGEIEGLKKEIEGLNCIVGEDRDEPGT